MSDHFDRWLAQHGPIDQADPQMVRRVGERIRDQRRARRRTLRARGATLGAAGAVLLLLTVVQAPRLGSVDRSTFVPDDRPDRVEHPIYGPTLIQDATTQPKYERYLDRFAAGLLHITAVDFFQVGTEEYWVVVYENLRESAEDTWARGPVEGPSITMTRETNARIRPWMARLDARIAPEYGTELPGVRIRVDGYDLWFRRWAIDVDGLTLIYGAAVIERPLPQRIQRWK
jgi:hypothetical protein